MSYYKNTARDFMLENILLQKTVVVCSRMTSPYCCKVYYQTDELAANLFLVFVNYPADILLPFVLSKYSIFYRMIVVRKKFCADRQA